MEVCPVLAYSLSSSVHGAEQIMPHSQLVRLPQRTFSSPMLGEGTMTSGTQCSERLSDRERERCMCVSVCVLATLQHTSSGTVSS